MVRRAMGYRKFIPGRPLKVLLLESGYHLQGECKDALTQLGHQVHGVYVKLADAAAVVRALLQALVQVRPDMVLCINHLGFDDGGTVGELLETLDVPVACWYVDSPFFVLRGQGVPANKVSSLFVWEETLLPCLRALGAQDVHYLPLACDLAKFTTPAQPTRYPVSFVGNSMEQPGKQWTQGLVGVQRARAAAWKARLEQGRADLVAEALQLQAADSVNAGAGAGAQAGHHAVWDALAAATYAATGTYRASLVRRAASVAPLHVFGDESWPQVLQGATLHPLVGYGAPLAQVYASSAINLNATSRQMPSAVNQRIFDVPAAGGFLLTDDQADAARHFVPGEEVVTFASADELADLLRFYAARPQLRAQVVARARARIVREHTYVHRLQQLLAVMRARHAVRRRQRLLGNLACTARS